MLQPSGTPEEGDVPIYRAGQRRTEWGRPGPDSIQAQLDSLQAQILALGSGGIPDPGGLSPQYNKTGGYGDRTAAITVICSANLLENDPSGTSSPNFLVNGNADLAPDHNDLVDPTGMFFKFSFDAPVLIKEIHWMLENSLTVQKYFGHWQWEGSNNGSSWTALGSAFDFDKNDYVTVAYGGPSNGHKALKFDLSTNTYLWQHYRMKCLSITGGVFATKDMYVIETEFKIDRL